MKLLYNGENIGLNSSSIFNILEMNGTTLQILYYSFLNLRVKEGWCFRKTRHKLLIGISL